MPQTKDYWINFSNIFVQLEVSFIGVCDFRGVTNLCAFVEEIPCNIGSDVNWITSNIYRHPECIQSHIFLTPPPIWTNASNWVTFIQNYHWWIYEILSCCLSTTNPFYHSILMVNVKLLCLDMIPPLCILQMFIVGMNNLYSGNSMIRALITLFISYTKVKFTECLSLSHEGTTGIVSLDSWIQGHIGWWIQGNHSPINWSKGSIRAKFFLGLIPWALVNSGLPLRSPWIQTS